MMKSAIDSGNIVEIKIARARRILISGSAIAISHGIIAILENFQQTDGTVKIPAALVPYVGFEVIKRK